MWSWGPLLRGEEQGQMQQSLAKAGRKFTLALHQKCACSACLEPSSSQQ